MKILTPERKEIIEELLPKVHAALIEKAKFQAPSIGWREQMSIVWKGEDTIKQTLGTSMTKTWDLIEGKVTLADLYDENGRPRVVKK